MSEDQDITPWWYDRCTHSWKDFNEWRVVREVEGVVILEDIMSNTFHITVDLAGVGSSCKTITRAQYESMAETDVLAYLGSQRQELRSLNKM